MLQHLAAETFKPAGAVADRHAGDDPGILAGKHAQRQAGQGPVDHVDPLEIAGADHQVGIFDHFQEIGNLFGVVGKVGVHLEDVVIAVFQGIFEPGNVGSSQSQFAGPLQHKQRRILLHQSANDLGRLVR